MKQYLFLYLLKILMLLDMGINSNLYFQGWTQGINC